MPDISDLISGYHRFRANAWADQRDRWAALVDGQAPRIMVIACSDSRVDPAQIFDVGPGEIFVVRNVAALVPPFETAPGHHGVSAALEFAVEALGVAAIVVLGHGRCGGCNAALASASGSAGLAEGSFIATWISLLDEARDAVAAEHGTEGRVAGRAMEQAAVKVSLDNLRSFPTIAAREQAGNLTLHGAYFAISDGVLHVLDEAASEFRPA